MILCENHQFPCIRDGLSENTPPLLPCDGSLPLAAWRAQAREKLNELLGLPLERCAAEWTVEYTTEQEDHTEIRFTVQMGSGYFVPLPSASAAERITAVAPSCSVCTYEDSIAAMPHCLCHHIPSIRKYFEKGDLAGRIAPRKLVIAAGREDAIFPLPGTERVFSQIARIYADAGVPPNCALVIGDGGHLNYADLLWEKLHKMGV